jgi:WXG100 family type VII secretion target
MPTTQAQAAVMEQTAARFEQVNEGLQGMLTRLMAELEIVRTQWQGAGGGSFDQVKQAWAADQRALQEALLATAAAIRTAGRRYHATDAEVASQVTRTARGPLDLPL